MTGYTNMLCWSLRLLLLGALLVAAAAAQYTEEIQNEEDEKYFLTAGRGPPVNVTVMPVLATALNVSWDPPEEEPPHYMVDIGFNNDVTYNTFYFQDGLQACTDYIIVVTSVYDTGEQYQAPTHATTGISVPPPPPKCWFNVTDTTFITAYWSDPSIQCAITNHNISWWSHVLWHDEEGSGNAHTTGNHYIIKNLQPYTNVTVSVAAATDIGYGSPTTCWDVTLQDKPGAPSITNLVSHEHLLNVSWTPPEEANGEILQYSINFENNNSKISENVTGNINNKSFSNIPLCELYDVTVAASTEAGWGPPSGSSSVMHIGTVPPSSVTCGLEEGHEPRVCWTPCPEKCLDDPTTHYSIRWEADILWSNVTDDGSNLLLWSGAQQLCYPLVTFESYTNYSFCVSVDGQVTPTACCSVLTPQAEPGPPVNLRVTSYDGSATVSWTPPDKANGVISIYEVKCESGNHSKSTNVTGEDTETVVDGLQVCENYSVTVRAMTEAGGWGPESEPAIVTIDGALVPSSVECSPDEDVKVCWTPSPGYCPMSSYNITWDGSKLWTHNTDHLDGSCSKPWDDESHLCYSLDTSVPYATYNVCVISVAGHNTATACCSMTTPQAAPGPPVLTDLHIDETSVTVSWDPPEEENGEITGYLVTYMDDDGHYLNQSAEENEYSSTITDLTRCENYTVSVQAETSAGWGESDGRYAAIPNTFSESAMTCSDDESRQVSLSWSLAVPDCAVSQYNLAWNTTVKWSHDHSGLATTPVPGNKLSYVQHDLTPYTDMTACLNIVTQASEKKCCTGTTREETASEPVSFTVVNKTTTEAGFAWSPPQHLNGKLESWILVWTQDNGKTDNTSIKSRDYQYVLKDLQSSTKYNVSLMAINGAGLGNPATVEVTTDSDSVTSNVGVIVGVTVGALMVIVIVGVGVFIYYRKKTLSNTPSDDRSNRGKRIWSGAAGNRSDSNSTISNNMAKGNSSSRHNGMTNGYASSRYNDMTRDYASSRYNDMTMDYASSRYNDMTRGTAPGSEDYLTKAIETSKLNAIKQVYALPRHNGMTNGYASSRRDESMNGSIYTVPRYEEPMHNAGVPADWSRRAPQPPRQLELSTLSDENTNDDTIPRGRRDQRLQRQNNIGRNGHSGLNRPREPYSRTSSRANNYPPDY